MAGHDPTIKLPYFQGEATKDPKKHPFICVKTWEAKQITDEDTKLMQLAIMLRDRAQELWKENIALTTQQSMEALEYKMLP
jgi:hypothetical protein